MARLAGYHHSGEDCGHYNCGHLSGTDSHPLCNTCLGVEHAMEALVNPTSCVHCAQIGSGGLRLRAKFMDSIAQASSLLEDDSVDNEVPEEGEATASV